MLFAMEKIHNGDVMRISVFCPCCSNVFQAEVPHDIIDSNSVPIGSSDPANTLDVLQKVGDMERRATRLSDEEDELDVSEY